MRQIGADYARAKSVRFRQIRVIRVLSVRAEKGVTATRALGYDSILVDEIHQELSMSRNLLDGATPGNEENRPPANRLLYIF